MSVEKKINKLIKSEIEKIGLTLYSVEYLTEDNIKYLRIKIDKPGYVTLKDCVDANKVIEPIIDEADLIDESYVLDICSKSKEEN